MEKFGHLAVADVIPLPLLSSAAQFARTFLPSIARTTRITPNYRLNQLLQSLEKIGMNEG